MNQVQTMMKVLMTQLQNNNPQMASEIKGLLDGTKNPQDIVKQVISGFSPYQKQNVLNQARSMGIPAEIIEQVQNMK